MRSTKSPLLLGFALGLGLVLGAGACKKPEVPHLYGEGRFRDITQIRVGMSPNEVERIMGSKHQTVWEEGIRGADGGNYVWQYAEGKVYFSPDGVFKVVPFK